MSRARKRRRFGFKLSRASMRFELSPAAMDRTWERALDQLRAEGHDPQELIRRAGENLARFRSMGELLAAIPWPDPEDEV